jgi:hypothetical protein
MAILSNDMMLMTLMRAARDGHEATLAKAGSLARPFALVQMAAERRRHCLERP